MKKTLSLLLVLAMVLSSFGFAFAAEDEVVPAEFLNEKGILKGNASGDLMLEENLKRQDMIVMLSRLLDVEPEAKAYEGETTFTDIADPFYVPYIAWAEAEELTEGVGDNKFGFDRAVKENEVVAFLLRALGYTDVAWEDVPAKAVELGLVEKDADLTVDAKREVLANLTYKALGMKMKDSEKTLAEELEIEMPVPAVLEVKEVVADNLKEIKVVFNKAVDEESAINPDNYEAPEDIKDITYNEDENTVILLLEEAMTNKKAYELVIKGVKDDKNALDVTKKFTAVDNAIPEVVEVVGLGTKALKIVVSEPIKEDVAKKTKNYSLNDGSYYGGVEVVGREIILRPFGGLKVGENEITVKGLEDFAGLKSIETKHTFEVVEDKDAPEVVEVEGTLERVVVTFNEDIDPNSVKSSNVYWMNGASKKAPRAFTRLAGNKYAFDFTDNPLPVYEVTLYIEKFADYSGNVMAKVEKPFRAAIDEQRPEIIKVELNDDVDTIIVKFNKAVEEVLKKNVTLTNVDTGKTVPVKYVVEEVSSKNRVFNIELYSALEAGEVYTLKVEGVKDKTRLANTMLPFEYKIEVDDYASASFITASGNVKDNTIYVVFDKAMDFETITNPANYLIRNNNEAARSLANVSVGIDVLLNGKAVVIQLPKKIGGVETEIGINPYELAVLGVKDQSGNLLKNYGAFKAISTEEPKLDGAPVAKDVDTIKVKFTQPVISVDSSKAFALSNNNAKITGISGEGTNTITLTVDELTPDAYNYTLSVDKAYLTFVIDGKLDKDYSVALKDEIKPSLDEVKAVIDGADVKLSLVFDEEIDLGSDPQKDIKVRRADGTEIKSIAKENIVKDGKKAVITIPLTVVGEDTRLSAKLDNPKFIIDMKGNFANASDWEEAGELIVATKPAAKAAAETAFGELITTTVNATNYEDAKAKIEAAEKAIKTAKEVGFNDTEIAGFVGYGNLAIAKNNLKTYEDTVVAQKAVNDEAAKIISLDFAVNDEGKLVLPVVSSGFNITINDSSNVAVIMLDGTVNKDATEQQVALRFEVTDSSGNNALTQFITVTVPGKSTDATLSEFKIGGIVIDLTEAVKTEGATLNLGVSTGLKGITVKTTDAKATVAVKKAGTLVSDLANETLVKDDVVTVEVIAEDAVTAITYKVTIAE